MVGSTDMPGRRRPMSESCGSMVIFTGAFPFQEGTLLVVCPGQHPHLRKVA